MFNAFPSFSLLIKVKLHQISISLVQNSTRVFTMRLRRIKKYSSKTRSILLHPCTLTILWACFPPCKWTFQFLSPKFITILDLVKWRGMHHCRAESSNTKVRDFWLENRTFSSKNNHSELLLRLNRLTTYPTSEGILWSYLAFIYEVILLPEWTPRQFIDFVALRLPYTFRSAILLKWS